MTKATIEGRAYVGFRSRASESVVVGSVSAGRHAGGTAKSWEFTYQTVTGSREMGGVFWELRTSSRKAILPKPPQTVAEDQVVTRPDWGASRANRHGCRLRILPAGSTSLPSASCLCLCVLCHATRGTWVGLRLSSVPEPRSWLCQKKAFIPQILIQIKILCNLLITFDLLAIFNVLFSFYKRNVF